MSSAIRLCVPSMADARWWLCVILLLLAQTVGSQGINFTLDFEEGDLRGWEATGTAFRFQPTLDDNPTARNRGMPSRHQGRYWIGTFERFQGRPRQRPGQVQGDEPQGELRSATFISPGGKLSFLIGGGEDFSTRVELALEDPIEGSIRVCYRTGSNSETMRRVECDLSEFTGRPMHIRIVDNSSAGWGHINVDDFQFRGLVEVPQLRNRELEQAYGMIEEAGLAIGPTNYIGTGDRPNIVVRQTPPAGQLVERGRRVTLYVSRPAPEPPPEEEIVVVVPELIDDTVQVAQRKIISEGLSLGEITRESSDRPAGIVIGQNPQPGEEVAPESPVDVVVSSGMPPVVEVPRVIGDEIGLAERKILAEGLRVGAVTEEDSDRPQGTVIEQEPRPGQEVSRGREVAVWVARAPDTTIVPNVVGMTLAGAARTLRSRELRTGGISRELSASTPNKVISQRPAAGTTVAPGSSVALVVASWAVWAGATVIGGLAAAVTVYRFWPSGPKSIPGVTTELHRDLGRIGDLSYDGVPIKSEIHARFVTDAGQQTVDAKRNVIKSETRNNDDD
jgi:beta-lactam-binding protein with PASTA domain